MSKMKSKIKEFVNGGAPALLRHLADLVAALVFGAFSVGILWSDVQATGKKADDNRMRVEAIERSIGEVTTQQRVLMERSDGDRERSKEFRENTARALERILERLPRPERRAR